MFKENTEADKVRKQKNDGNSANKVIVFLQGTVSLVTITNESATQK